MSITQPVCVIVNPKHPVWSAHAPNCHLWCCPL